MPTTILRERIEEAIELVTLNRPASLNAMSSLLVAELHETLEAIAADGSCRVVVLTGAGRGFCSGHDLRELGEMGTATVARKLNDQEALASLVLRMRSLPQPIVAAVNGAATGGGLGLALAADTRVCSRSARFSAAFVRVGLSGCGMGVSWLLPRVVGTTLAFEMMLTGRLVDAEEAVKRGLASRLVDDGAVVEAAVEIGRGIRENTPLGVRMTKRTMWATLDASTLANAVEMENRTQVLCARAEAFSEVVEAFMERRPHHSPATSRELPVSTSRPPVGRPDRAAVTTAPAEGGRSGAGDDHPEARPLE